MLVINLHTLQTINVLNLIHDVLLHGCGTLDGQDVGWRDSTIGKWSAGTNVVVLLNQYLTVGWNEVLLDGLFTTQTRSDDDFAITTLQLTHRDFAINFGNSCGVARVASLEELCNARQTAGDITTATDDTRYLNEHVTCLDFLTVFDGNVTTDGKVVVTQDVAVFIKDMNGGHTHSVVRLYHDEFLQARLFVGLDLIVDTFDNVLELHLTRHFGHNNCVEGIPLCDDFVLLDNVAVVLIKCATIWHIGCEQDDSCGGVDEANFCQTTYHYLCRGTDLIHYVNGTQFLELEASVVLCLDAGIGGCITCHTTCVEGSQRQLCTRLTNGLSCDDAHCFALLHHTTGSEVAAVALHADTLLAFASEHGTYLD